MSKMLPVGPAADYPCGGAAVEFGCDTEGVKDSTKGVCAAGVDGTGFYFQGIGEEVVEGEE